MAKQGRLTPEKFGYTMPVDEPLYPKPPVYYRDMETITVSYETDENAALDILPEAAGFELTLPATVRIVIAKMPFTTFGAYEEAYQFLDCTWEGEPCIYPVRILLNQESALAAGREIWGNPKKLGHIEWQQESEVMQGIVERPKGTRICTVQMKPERPVDLEPYDMKPMGLRVIPNPEGGDPSLADLVLNSCHVTPKQAWSGRGSISFGVESDLDPWHTLPVRRVTDALYVRSDMDVAPTAKVVKRFF